MNIPLKELKTELRTNQENCKQQSTYDNIIISKSIFGLFSKMINKFEQSKSYQSGLFVKSMNDWLDRKDDNLSLDKSFEDIKIGDIFMVDWNISYSPELCYEHPCVIIEIIDDFIFALPVSSQKQYIEIGYHPIKNCNGDKNYRLVGDDEGFKKECVIHMNQAKTISKTRLLYKMGSLSVDEEGNCSFLCELKNELINKYFQEQYNELLAANCELKRRVNYLSIQRKANQSRADKYRNENKQLKKQIEELKAIVDKA